MAACVVCDMQVTCFSEYCDDAFSVEAVNVVYEADESRNEVTPDLSDREAKASVDDINGVVGVTLEPTTICTLLTKMQLRSEYDYETNQITVLVPPSRPDILHQCDIIGAWGRSSGRFARRRRGPEWLRVRSMC